MNVKTAGGDEGAGAGTVAGAGADEGAGAVTVAGAGADAGAGAGVSIFHLKLIFSGVYKRLI